MAVIDHDRMFAYLHIPKSGGNAVSHWLMDHVPRPTVVMEGRNDLAGEVDKHSPVTAFTQWMHRNGKRWTDYTSFAVLRNPFTRPISVFTELHRNSTYTAATAGPEWWKAFKALPGVNAFVTSGMYDPHGPVNMMRTQRWFVSDGDGNVIITHLIDFTDFAEKIPEITGLPGPIPVVHKGQYQFRPLSTEARRIVVDKYATDFDLYEGLRAR